MIQWINLRSQWKPFQVAGAGPARFEGINWEPSMSAFEWWNHWPVAQIAPAAGRRSPRTDPVIPRSRTSIGRSRRR